MKNEIVITGPMYPDTMRQLEERFLAHRLWEAADRKALLASVAERVRGMATPGGVGADAALMDQLPRLEIIACFAVGVDAVDLEAAKARGIAVTNTPDVLTDEVADLAIALVLASSRLIVRGDRFVRAGKWLQGPLPLGHRVRGRRMGIIGCGRIGQAIAKLAGAFEMSVVYHGPRAKPELPYRYFADPVAMAKEVDFLVVASPGGAGTRHLVNAAVLDALGPQGTIVNIARGSVIDEEALVQALRDGRLGAAALDVFADEPRVPEALFAMENVILQPHQGSGTHETRAAMGQLVVDNLAAHFAGRQLLTPVVQLRRPAGRAAREAPPLPPRTSRR
jgi:lactate dehydrogenase-like 2-hydroxyacid dehydrogenase